MEDKSGQIFKVIITGQIVEGLNPEEVKENLVRLFKANPDKVSQFLTGKPKEIKSGLSRHEAEKYKKALIEAGALCTIEPIPSSQLQDTTPVSTSQVRTSTASSSKNLAAGKRKDKAEDEADSVPEPEDQPEDEPEDEEEEDKNYNRRINMEYGGGRPNIPPIRTEPPLPVEPFFTLLPSVFPYPFLGSGKWLLLSGVITYTIASYVPVIGGFLIAGLTGYFCAFMMKIIVSSSRGDKELPDWPDFSTIWDDIIRPFLLVLEAFIFSNLPALLYLFFIRPGGLFLDPVFLLLSFLGGIYFPMSLVAISMSDSITAIGPHIVIPAILRVFREYMVAFAVMCGIIIANGLLSTAIMAFFAALGLSFIGIVIQVFLSLYLLIVEMRILGILYYTNKERFGWL